MNENETAALVRAFDRAYINGKFVTPHGTQIVDLVNPANNTVIGKVTMADEIDTRQAIAAAREAFNTFSQSSKEYRMDCLQRLHDAVARRMDQLVDATVLEYGAPQDRAKGSNNLAANIFLHFKEVLRDFDLARTVGTSTVVMEPAGVVGIFTPWNSSAGSIAIKVAPAIAAGCTVVIKPSEMSAMQTEVLMDAFHEAGLPPGVINFVTGLGEVVGTELTKSPDIQKIAFTGSTQIGKLVAKNSLDTMKRLTLELGGKSPNIILDDADFSTAIPMAVAACYLNNGQTCSHQTCKGPQAEPTADHRVGASASAGAHPLLRPWKAKPAAGATGQKSIRSRVSGFTWWVRDPQFLHLVGRARSY